MPPREGGVVVVSLSLRMRTRLAGIRDVCRKQKTPALLWSEIRDMILEAVPGDFGTFGIMDPVTALFVDGYSFGDRPERADVYMSRYYLKREAYSYLDLRAEGKTIFHASQFTGGQLEKDPLFAEWLVPEGFKHGARAACVSGHYYWGGLCLIRGNDVPDFNRRELNFLKSIVEPIGNALRVATAWNQAYETSLDPLVGVGDGLPDSGVLLLDRRHRVLFRTEGVRAIIRDIVAATRPDVKCTLEAGGTLPWVVHAASARLWAAIENGYKTNNPTVVVKGCSQWWTVTATVPEAGMSEEVATVLIISRSHPRDTAPVLLAAYGLTEREQDVINLIRLGMSTEAIARRLFVSRYTVQDHLKNIFAKVGVRTRGELMAVIFREESPVGRPVAQGERGVVERATDGTR